MKDIHLFMDPKERYDERLLDKIVHFCRNVDQKYLSIFFYIDARLMGLKSVCFNEVEN